VDNEITLSNSVVERTEELIASLKGQIEDRRSTDGVTFSLGIHYVVKHSLRDIHKLIADSGLDGRFRKRRKQL
jgi:hypothetical protein